MNSADTTTQRPTARKLAKEVPPSDFKTNANTIAIIDIGSNSVRLVVYDLSGGRCRYLLNEKVQAGLGRGLLKGGKLCPQGVEIAMNALSRYATLIETLGITQVHTGATGAVRDASDSARFCKQVKQKTGLCLRVLSGTEEARYAALGVLMSYPDGHGLVGDLGGWSLELAHIHKGEYKDSATCAIGPFALESLGAASNKSVRQHARTSIRALSSFRSSNTLYLVGGAWRAIARIHMRQSQWPLLQLQHYVMDTKTMRPLLKRIHNQDPELTPITMQIANRRAPYLPYAAMVLDTLISETGAKRLMMSLRGVREGLLIEAAGNQISTQDVLLPYIRADQARFAKATANWIAKIPNLPSAALIHAACAWSLAIAGLVPDGRAEIGFDMVAQADLRHLSQTHRLILALAVASAHHRAFTNTACETLLSPEQRTQAYALGALIRLAGELSGTTSILLKHVRLKACLDQLILETDEACLISETAKRRLTQAAQFLSRTAQVRVTEDN